VTSTLIVYLLAGVGFSWALPAKWWQRLLMIPLWSVMIIYGMLNQVVEWSHTRGYQYDDDVLQPDV
jgi:hypothetical protein